MTVPQIFMTAYQKLADAMVEYRGGKHDDDTLLYTQVAFKFIMGVSFTTAIEMYSPSTIAGALNLFLSNATFECTCPPDHEDFECFQCNVDRDAKKEIRARNNLMTKGVIT